MGYRSLARCVADLESTGQLIVIDEEVDPYLEAAAIQRRVYQAGGPALLFRRVKGTAFPMVSNLFGTLERARFLFRDTLEPVRQLVELKVDPGAAARRPWRYRGAAPDALAPAAQARPSRADPRRIRRRSTGCRRSSPGRWTAGRSSRCPRSTPRTPTGPAWRRSNLGMYRVQLSGNEYEPNREVGLHYQIHRGIGVHHAAAIRRGEPLRVNVFVGGPPALTVAAVMPLPEGLPELAFAGALGGRRVAMVAPDGWPAHAGRGRLRDHRHGRSRTRASPKARSATTSATTAWPTTSPCCASRRVYHRHGRHLAVHLVGRPPQEDTTFGELIHELTGPIIPTVIPGVHAVHAVDAAGVHPLLLAIGSERYVPYATGPPAAGDAHDRQRHPRPGAALAGEVPAHRRPRGRPRARHPRHPRVLPPPARAGRLDERPAFPDADDDRHARLLRPRPEPGLEGGDRRRRAHGAANCPPSCPPGLRLPDGFRDPRVVLPGHPRRSRARAIAPGRDDRRRVLPGLRSRRPDPELSR